MAKSNIIKDLAKGIVDTETALKELKLLLLSFPNEKLLQWVNRELSGYSTDDVVPEYRRKAASLKGSFVFYNTSYKNVGIPMSREMPDEVKETFEYVEVRHSIRSLRELENKEISFPISPNLYPYIMRYSKIGMTGVLDAKLDMGITTVAEIISSVENKVLDAMLLLEKQFGCLDDLDIDLSGTAELKVNEIEKQLLVIIYNDNSISIGDRNKIAESQISNGVNNY